MADSQHTHTPSVTVGVLLAELTWAELRTFVHLCRGIDDSERVGVTFDRDSFDRIGLEEIIPVSVVMPDGA
jgi:hypothetical protein